MADSGDIVIVDGIQKLRPGIVVVAQPLPVKVDSEHPQHAL